jgi:hypothetical protein
MYANEFTIEATGLSLFAGVSVAVLHFQKNKVVEFCEVLKA